jgi:Fe2+ or Zn2+ uptake regulation protein
MLARRRGPDRPDLRSTDRTVGQAAPERQATAAPIVSRRAKTHPVETRYRFAGYNALMVEHEPLVAALDVAGYRLTASRRMVSELIAAREGHFTASDLIDDARARRLGIGRATIFRALDLFEELNLLERLDLPSGEHAYVPCEPQHHHHVVCGTCGRTTEVDDQGLLAAVDEIERRTGYQIETHRLELYGRCPRCRQRRSN